MFAVIFSPPNYIVRLFLPWWGPDTMCCCILDHFINTSGNFIPPISPAWYQRVTCPPRVSDATPDPPEWILWSIYLPHTPSTLEGGLIASVVVSLPVVHLSLPWPPGVAPIHYMFSGACWSLTRIIFVYYFPVNTSALFLAVHLNI